MHRLALVLAVVAVVAACRPDPGQYLALGLGLGAIGTGWVAYARRALPGLARLVGAAAIAVGSIAVVLGSARIVLAIAALGRVERMLG